MLVSKSGFEMRREPWGVVGGADVWLWQMKNPAGATVSITNLGGIVTSLQVPDRDGELADVVLGFDKLADYVAGHPHFGCITGRYANRIAKGAFTIGDQTYQLDLNNGANSLHGGFDGFDKRVWTADDFGCDADGAFLALRLVSPDGDQGFPGTLSVTAVYRWTADSTLDLTMEATTDAPTVCNLTQHAYFNLDGAVGGHVLDHELQVEATQFLPIDDHAIPLGAPAPIHGTPFDFLQAKPIGRDIEADDNQLRLACGYDHNWLITGSLGQFRRAATLVSPKTGRSMEAWTTDPGLQVYTANFLDGAIVGKSGVSYPRRSGVCLEPQRYPDSPNRPEYPSTLLLPGAVYRHRLAYRFGVQ